MRTVLIVLALLLVAHTAGAASPLRGQWRVTSESQPTYIGVVLIDADRRATWESPVDHGRPAKFDGYVAAADDAKVEMLFTDRVNVVRTTCTVQSEDLLRCQHTFSNKSMSAPFMLVRVGPGPERLVSVLP